MDLPLHTLSLPEFCEAAKDLLKADDIPSFVTLVLNGVHDGHQVIVDPIRDRLGPTHAITGMRDYDSLLGIDRDIKIDDSLTLFPIAQLTQTLKKNIYISFSFENDFGPHTVPVHYIPNLCIGKWSVHSLIRVLFTGLYKPNTKREPALGADLRKTFCEKGYWPAIRQLMGARGHDWPSDYASELFRAQSGETGHFLGQSKMVPDYVVADLAQAIRDNLALNNVPWADGIYILHQLQGVKNELPHSVTADAAEDRYHSFLGKNKLSAERLETGQWYIDIGLEVTSSRGECLAWRTDGHAEIVGNIAFIDDLHANRITRPGSSKYARDMTSHLPAVSGCRIAPGSQAEGPYKIKYLQLYQTCKSLTARKDGSHHGKYITGSQILSGKSEKYLDKLYNLYQSASGVHISLARAEVRVPIAHATEPFFDLNNVTLKSCLVGFPKVVWWSLRAYRALAYTFIIESQLQGPVELRLKLPALLLTAAAPWFLNSLHCTPDTQSASRDLLTAILPHVQRVDADVNALPFIVSTRPRPTGSDDEEDNDALPTDESDSDSEAPPRRPRVRAAGDDTVPYIPYGLLFLRKIRLGPRYPIPRFDDRDRRFIQDKTFKFIFNIHLEGVSFEVLSRSMVPPNPTRISNRIHSTTRFIDQGQHAEPIVFDIARDGHALQLPPNDEGSDMDRDSDSPPPDPLPQGLDAELSDLWYQFLSDVTAKSPNRSTQRENTDAYCKLTREQRLAVNDDTYRNRNLADYFQDCQWTIGTASDWDLVFRNFFPRKNRIKGKVQNYSAMIYYKKWRHIMNASTPRTEMAIRYAIRQRFDALYWLPYACSDRVWWTKVEKPKEGKALKFRKSSGEDRTEPSPRVIVRGVAPTWQTDD